LRHEHPVRFQRLHGAQEDGAAVRRGDKLSFRERALLSQVLGEPGRGALEDDARRKTPHVEHPWDELHGAPMSRHQDAPLAHGERLFDQLASLDLEMVLHVAFDGPVVEEGREHLLEIMCEDALESLADHLPNVFLPLSGQDFTDVLFDHPLFAPVDYVIDETDRVQIPLGDPGAEVAEKEYVRGGLEESGDIEFHTALLSKFCPEIPS
jgi:hypothetical protein